MIKFAENYMGVVADGNLTVREGLICGLLAVLALLLIVGAVMIIRSAVTHRKQKKNSIFRNKKKQIQEQTGKEKYQILSLKKT